MIDITVNQENKLIAGLVREKQISLDLLIDIRFHLKKANESAARIVTDYNKFMKAKKPGKPKKGEKAEQFKPITSIDEIVFKGGL